MALMMVTQELSAADVLDPSARHRLPGFGRADDERRARPAARRLAGGDPAEGAEGRRADRRAARLAACRRPISTPSARRRRSRSAARRATASSPPSSCIRRSLPTSPPRRRPTARPRCCRRRPISTACRRARRSRSSWRRARSSSSAARRSARPDEDGEVRVFFELNGQPRIARVPDRAHGAGARARAGRRPSPAIRRMSPRRCRASSPASRSRPGQDVRAGDVLLSIEAMKMETALHADRDGTVAEVLVKAGDQIDAKDLLIGIRELTRHQPRRRTPGLRISPVSKLASGIGRESICQFADPAVVRRQGADRIGIGGVARQQECLAAAAAEILLLPWTAATGFGHRSRPAKAIEGRRLVPDPVEIALADIGE